MFTTTNTTSEEVSSTQIKSEFKLTARQQRVCSALAKFGKLWREEVDRIAGASNGPEVMHQLKRKGLEWECDRIKGVDRDGNACEPGLYSIVGGGRETLHAWGFTIG
jgi:hypothetical protein